MRKLKHSYVNLLHLKWPVYGISAALEIFEKFSGMLKWYDKCFVYSDSKSRNITLSKFYVIPYQVPHAAWFLQRLTLYTLFSVVTINTSWNMYIVIKAKKCAFQFNKISFVYWQQNKPIGTYQPFSLQRMKIWRKNLSGICRSDSKIKAKHVVIFS